MMPQEQQTYRPDQLITAYYLGGLGGDDRPITIRLRGGKLVQTPPIGEPFARRFTPAQYKDLEMQCGYHDERGRFITTVTRVKSKAELAKNGKKSAKAVEPTVQAQLTDEQLLAELKARGLDVVLAQEAVTVTEQPKEEKLAPKRATKKEVTQDA